MPPRKRRGTRELVRSQSKAIAVLSSSLVLRGLREFPHNPTWRVKQAFAGARRALAISQRGYVAAYGAEGTAQGQNVEIYDLELSWLPTIIAVPGESTAGVGQARAALGWAPSGKSLVATNEAGPQEFLLVDAAEGRVRGRFGNFDLVPESLSWSRSSKYFAACSNGSENGKLQLWKSGDKPQQFGLLREVSANAFEEGSSGEDLGDQGKLWGFGCAAFHPGEKSLAAVLEYDGEWSDDSILLLSVPALEKISRFDATGHVTGLCWSRDGRQLFFCASGQTYSADPESGEVTSLPFAAELCCQHPTQPLCAFYNSLLKSSEKGRIFIADMRSMSVVDECWAEAILDVQWSADGRMLYAVSEDGSAYLYEQHQV